MNFIIEHKIFLIPVFVILFTQTIKFINLTLKNGFKWHNLFEPGHFPSAHSAFVTALVICVGYYTEENSFSSEFAVAVCFAFITIYDALRVRMQIGIQGKTLNNLVRELGMNEKKFPHLNEHVGHYTSEVFGGILIGIILSFGLIKIFEVFN
jgi:acid phosphatase family membrane protein YuiD